MLPHTLRVFYKQIPDNSVLVSKLQMRFTRRILVWSAPFLHVFFKRFPTVAANRLSTFKNVPWRQNLDAFSRVWSLQMPPPPQWHQSCLEFMNFAWAECLERWPHRGIPQHGCVWLGIPRLEIHHAGDSSSSFFRTHTGLHEVPVIASQ
jgi:hypothetical protein